MDQLILAPSERRQFIVDLLRLTRHRVILSMFRCDDDLVLDEIVAAAEREVDVKVLLTPRASGWNKRLGELGRMLQQTGVDVRQYAGAWAKYHAKYIVVDDEIAVVGSLNLTRKCFEDTCDFVLLSRRPALISGLTTLFYFDWHAPDVTLPEIPEPLIIGPDRSRLRILPILGEARHRIRIIDHRVTEPQVLHTLGERMKAGVQVEILGRGDVGQMISHGKMILVDERIAVIGSASLSRTGMDERREVAVVVHDPGIVEQLSRFFEESTFANTARTARSERPANPRDDDDDEDDDED